MTCRSLENDVLGMGNSSGFDLIETRKIEMRARWIEFRYFVRKCCYCCVLGEKEMSDE